MQQRIIAIWAAVALALTGSACAEDVTIADGSAAQQETPTPAVEPATPSPAPSPADSAPPESRRDHYDIAMTINTGSGEITQDIALTIHNYSADNWTEIVIRDYLAVPEMYGDGSPAQGEGISAVTLESGEALSFASDQNDASIVRIALAAPLAPGERVVLRLAFSAVVSDAGDRCLFGTLSENDGSGARTVELSAFVPTLAIYAHGDWVCEPYFTEGECMYSRCADYDIALSLPHGWVVVATGDERQTENGSNTDWHISARNVRDMALVASNELSVLTERVGDITINSYFGSAGEKNRLQGQESLRIAKEAAAFFEESFGVYPYDELDVVQSCNAVGGIEAPGLIRIGHLFAENLGPDGGDADSHLLGDCVAHETAHQWFYGVVGSNPYREAWLDEGIASVASLLYAKHCGWGQAYVDEQLELLHMLLREDESAEHYIDRPYDEITDNYGLTVYQRAEEFLYRLSEAMGETEFLRFLSGYYTAFSFREATTSDFLNALAPYISDNDAAQALVRENISAAN